MSEIRYLEVEGSGLPEVSSKIENSYHTANFSLDCFIKEFLFDFWEQEKMDRFGVSLLELRG
jgi:hypothetical protein